MGNLRKAVGPLPRIEHGTSVTDTEVFYVYTEKLIEKFIVALLIKKFLHLT